MFSIILAIQGNLLKSIVIWLVAVQSVAQSKLGNYWVMTSVQVQ